MFFYTTRTCTLLSISENYTDTYGSIFIKDDIKLRLVFYLPYTNSQSEEN